MIFHVFGLKSRSILSLSKTRCFSCIFTEGGKGFGQAIYICVEFNAELIDEEQHIEHISSNALLPIFV